MKKPRAAAKQTRSLLTTEELARVIGGWTDGSVWPVGTVANGAVRLEIDDPGK